MRGIKRTICALCLLALFVAYQASITAFTHVHYVNGVLITHSHPFHNQHSHSTDSLIVIGLLSHFSSDTPDCCELQHPMRFSVAGDGKRNRYARHKGKSVSDALSPRSPLFRYPLIVLYQRLVCFIPTLGIRCTDAWYSMYQSLVLAVPMFGIRRTRLWYLPYQVPVQNWYH